MMLGVSLVLGLFGLGAYLWALKNGQFDDLEGERYRIILDDEEEKEYQKRLDEPTCSSDKSKR